MYVRGSGIVVDQPSVAGDGSGDDFGWDRRPFSNQQTDRTTGRDGRKPLLDGVIADFEAAVSLLSPIVRMARRFAFLTPGVLVSAPTDACDAERETLVRAIRESGAACVGVVPDPLAGGLGAGLDIKSPYTQMVVDIGEGMTDIAVIRSGCIIAAAACRKACAEFHDGLIRAVLDRYGIVLYQSEARRLVHELGAAPGRVLLTCSTGAGVDLRTGCRARTSIRSQEVSEAIAPVTRTIAGRIANLLRWLPDQIACEVIESGICLTGGGACLQGMPEFLAEATGLDVRTAADPMLAVINGVGLMTEHGVHLDSWPRPTC